MSPPPARSRIDVGEVIQPAPGARRGSMSVLLAAALAIGAVLLVSLAGAFFPPGAWYEGLAKPGFTPPNAVFGPVWGVMYTFNAIALFLLLRAPLSAARGAALAAMAVQLVLNAAWTPVFFGAQMTGLALIVIVALAFAIVAAIALARRVSAIASALLVPYLGWVAFASALNAAIWFLNR
jgi:tryptophan-rich sensory protein